MTRQIVIEIPQGANMAALHAELRAAVGQWVAGVSRTRGVYTVVVEDDAPEDAEQQFAAVIAAHDPGVVTASQQAQANAAAAEGKVRDIPGWATWDESQAVGWIAENVTDLASAKVALTAMARMLVALRDAQWPGLGVE